jgi:hypothetical protein
MDILIRWKCPERHASGIRCSQCQNTDYIERWMPLDLLKTLPTVNWIIIGRRASDPSHT